MNGATPFICIILVLSIFMVIIGTIYDIFIHQKCTNKEDETNNKINTKNGTIQEMEMEGVSSLPESKLGMILICFSAYTNTKVIFNTKLHPDTLPIIHGLRFLNMCWVIVAHCVIYIIDYLGK
ncbi:nose resistant to fluoxetine protein 6-like [Pogonomyrmex barbatus]|uniref:Nose resistant to fluoxetine protein 6-like n=1 Tax=Pogonomyrmex barbatus TaxID=144034 RepID=A0A6I9VSM7_9HYME|nr:nose resistant to fluoxetine protein 6-like [Pogonomyrmex barbatus]